MIKEIILIGAFHEIIEMAEDLNIKILGLIDNRKNGEYRGYPVLATDMNADSLSEEFKQTPLVITPDQPSVRMKLSAAYTHYGYHFTTLIAKECRISKSAELGKGVIAQSGVNISAQARIADFVKLNTSCNIMHDTVIGKYSTVAPNAVVLGNVNVGESCYIGSNSTILPNVSICNNVIIGAGAVVTKDIDVPGVFIGLPARKRQ
ncbi:sugar O-acyltransferase (sialic acid O-acetyltransferase NeuD family) [Arcticibacter tournemirensis]|uniref:Acetyltransferase n=1 Tax=Arcticibacter tournemirensis TaxID=699437 RepID=A0A5M9HH53_9SPHI|nr:NeuD/PglB/VioB family sugar acetyltransferase [Arcticibacter tournemirensis]KAA8484658.1 hypothetical protein F1649_05645 [Arcticibacter tournemirensis]TQM47051.1 sugar O-acyltransferase (sialic acid O-acetyltransferase NeuD family) [Arcticibacter tournemirensis]